MAAKKSLALYPPAGETAMAWIERLRRAFDDAFRQGLLFPIRVGRDRFSWAGGDLPTTDQGLKGLRFEMQSRGIADLSIEPSVENWELQALLELLNQPVARFASTTAAHTDLRDRAVVRVSVGALGLAGLPARPGRRRVLSRGPSTQRRTSVDRHCSLAAQWAAGAAADMRRWRLAVAVALALGIGPRGPARGQPERRDESRGEIARLSVQPIPTASAER